MLQVSTNRCFGLSIPAIVERDVLHHLASSDAKHCAHSGILRALPNHVLRRSVSSDDGVFMLFRPPSDWRLCCRLLLNSVLIPPPIA